ncbi:MAG: mannonate dehydratase [Reichenbachiella sp.]
MKLSNSLEQLMRWYGPNDVVQLSHIAQAGCTGVVSALHSVAVGEVWAVDDIKNHKRLIESQGLTWTVVESLPVHEDIKSQKEGFEQYIINYKVSLVNLAKCGIKVVTYNFMPLLDWVRTNIAYTLPNGSEALFFNKSHYIIFDLFVLERPGAKKDYSKEELAKYTAQFNVMSEEEIARIKKTVLLGLPGSEVPFTTEEVLALLKQYKDINEEKLKSHLIHFLKEIIPTVESGGMQLAIHPDDPPFSVLGLPRVMSTNTDIEDLMSAVPSVANGLCFCTGSFGAREDNDLVEMIKTWGERVFFLHLRNTKRDEEGNFMEANHLEGDADMFAIMKAAVGIMHTENRSIPMRPDHGHSMIDDLTKKAYPGYTGIGRLKSLAELRGLEYAIQRMNTKLFKTN